MKKQLLLITIVLIAIIAAASATGAYYLTLPKNETPTTTPTPAPTSTLNPTSIPTPTSTATATAAPTTRPTNSPQPTTNPTATNPPTTTATPTPTPTAAPTSSPTPTPTASPTSSPTPTASPSPTPTASPSPTPIPTPSVGYARSNPAPIGTELVTMFPYSGTSLSLGSVKITEVIRGEEAWTQIHAANMYNSAPTAGNEYILVKIYFRYAIGLTADTSYTVSQYNFYAISENGLQYTSQAVVTPTPRFDAALYPGASIEGWAAYQVAITDTHPLLAFARNYDGTGGIWFKLY